MLNYSTNYGQSGTLKQNKLEYFHTNIEKRGQNPDSLTIINSIAHIDQQLKTRSYLNIDSITTKAHIAIRLCKKINNTSALVKLYESVGKAYMFKYIQDSAQHYFKLCLTEDSITCNASLLAQHYLLYGRSYFYNANWDSALYMLDLSIDLANETKDTILLHEAVYQKSRVYIVNGDWVSGTKLCLDFIRRSQLRKDTANLIRHYFTLAGILSRMNLEEEYQHVFYQMLNLAEYTSDSLSLFNIYNVAAVAYYRQNKLDSASYFARLNIPYYKQQGIIPWCWLTIAGIFLANEQIDSAKYYYSILLQECTLYKSYIEPNIFLGLGECEFKCGNDVKALEYYKLAESNLDKEEVTTKQNIYNALFEYYTATNQHKIALEYYIKQKVIGDSIRSSKNVYDLVSATNQYERDIMESQIQLLMKDKQLQVAIASKESIEKNVLFGSIGIVLLFIGLGFIKYRNHKNLKAKKDLINERLRISRDLHDEVGATLSGLALYSHIARVQVKNEERENVDQSLSIMQKSAGEMVNKLSDIVWLMNPEQETILKLFERLGEYARQMASTKKMQVKIDLPQGISQLNMPLETRRNIYLFCKEAINNAVKYSDGSRIELQVSATRDQITFTVKDDGKGFNEITVKRGNGLNNMKKRAEEIGATLHIGSKLGHGTEIVLNHKLTQ